MIGSLHVYRLPHSLAQLNHDRDFFLKDMVKVNVSDSPYKVLGKEPDWEAFRIGSIAGQKACILFEREWQNSIVARVICAALLAHEGRRIMVAVLPRSGNADTDKAQMLSMLDALLREIVLSTPEEVVPLTNKGSI